MPASDEVGIPPDLIEASDADLIGRAAQGDARALEVLYERYSGVVFSFALRIVTERPLAEEILQEAFFRAWQQGGNFSASRGIVYHLAAEHHAQPVDRRDSTAAKTAAKGGQRRAGTGPRLGTGHGVRCGCRGRGLARGVARDDRSGVGGVAAGAARSD